MTDFLEGAAEELHLPPVGVVGEKPEREDDHLADEVLVLLPRIEREELADPLVRFRNACRDDLRLPFHRGLHLSLSAPAPP